MDLEVPIKKKNIKYMGTLTYKKAQEKFILTDVLVWQPKTYFGRVKVISVFDAIS